jgi:hypothetical protein
MTDLALYRVPDSARIGVDIALKQYPDVVFRVKLPSKHNRAYTRALRQAMFAGARMDASGQVDVSSVDITQITDARIGAFAEHCLCMPLPTGMTREMLADEYYPALEELFETASDMADAADAEGEKAAKKSRPSSSGK